ncbi:DUF2849 domain-containing protein [Ponticaulis profundi]|uniref:DUF2849 domain-containing protein n=1 Tax=Ponticaulis profundi TaxID=2665222 RepID=A0ABW1S625_9PROT|tara:strand:- start:149 stop:460 length:312 start_codon:yes stop_codon:yes gene_type:complete
MTSVRPKLSPDTPKVITAWDVRTGVTVYRTSRPDWSESLSDAAILKGEDAESALAAAKEEETLVLDPYVMEVTEDGAVNGRETLRESIRARGPTTHPEYHKTV